MEQESTFSENYFIKKSLAIIGAGPAGCACAKFLLNSGIRPTIFDKDRYLRTILPTGGGRCNLAYAEYDFKQLAKNYPRGEKFLYSVFTRFGAKDSTDFFNSIGIKTYIQKDNRIFPASNSSKEVREKLLKAISQCNFIKEEIKSIEKLDNCYKIKTNKSTYAFDIVIIATGGHSDYEILNKLDLTIEPPVQSLVGLITKEDFSKISGVSLKDIHIKYKKINICGDIIFTHKGISGPAIYKLSSINAKKELPYKIYLQFIENINLQELLDKNPHKEIKNLLGQIVPKSLAAFILDELKTPKELLCHKVNRILRESILEKLTNFEVTITGKNPDGEVVTCGGVNLNEINPKSMESKRYQGLYFCGEILDIDGFCGGFNLQNCWSTAYIVAESIKNL